MNNTILVGIDFSECSLNALSHAVSIAEKSNSNIVMVWVNKLANDKDIVSKDNDLIVLGATQRFSELLEKYEPVIGKDKISYIIKEGRVYEAMQAACEELDPMLVVIGTHGMSGFSARWLGSNAYRMSLLIDVPIITIRGGVDINKTISKILLPIDSTTETRQKLPLTALLAKYFNATIYVLGIYTSEVKTVNMRVNSYVKQVVNYLVANEIDYVIDELHGTDVADELILYASKINANLISIMDEQERSAANFFSGSSSLQLVTKSPYPILISHAKNIYSTISKN
ncbi:MAG: universal stress protein [Bacteroidales bacterium]|nr:universal stress protein [Bacteroidales bacterium]